MKKAFPIFAVFATFLLFASFNFSTKESKRIIVIDAGHGGIDLGTNVGEIYEKIIVEQIAVKIRKSNKNKNIKLVLLRDGDEFLELKDRVEKINSYQAEMMISLHINMNDEKSINGVNAYISKENSFYKNSHSQANQLLKNLSRESLKNGGIIEKDLYVLKNANCPAVLLEIGFLSNEKDRNYITSKEGQNQIAKQICNSF